MYPCLENSTTGNAIVSRVFPCYVNSIYQSKTCESDTGNVQISRLFNSLLVGKPQIVSHFLQISYGRLTTSVHTAVIAIISKVQKIFDCLINILIFFSSLNLSYTANISTPQYKAFRFFPKFNVPPLHFGFRSLSKVNQK